MQSLICYGYGNDSMVRFLEVLQAHQIVGVLDIRDESLYIRDEFDPEQLAVLLARITINYAQVGPLIIPDSLAQRPRTNGSAGSFLREYALHLATLEPAARNALQELLRRDGNWMLLCAEENPDICHRSIAAGFLAELGNIPDDAIREVTPE